MTVDEFDILVKAMKAMYADPKFIADSTAYEMWYSLIGYMNYQTASEALQAHLRTSTRLPAVADFVKYASQKSNPQALNAEEAWALVTKALRNGLYGAEEEYAKLPPAIQKAVGSPINLREWAQLEKDDVQGVQKSHFVRAYRTEMERAEQDRLLPLGLRGETNAKIEVRSESPKNS